MNVFVWLIAAFGITQILVYSRLFETFRDWLPKKESFPRWFASEVLGCVMCCSTWVGFAMSLTIWSPASQCLQAPASVSWFFDGMFASGGCWIINTIVSHFDNE